MTSTPWDAASALDAAYSGVTEVVTALDDHDLLLPSGGHADHARGPGRAGGSAAGLNRAREAAQGRRGAPLTDTEQAAGYPLLG
ncbi:hypothetical protein AB0M20_07890 [Actinoplanes sp. NPDC051633]|uniref:hypothetical protein n=1 Tax=Actinoplanes sp. NPDC051633 TaxID=3155670 RepID=UPI0034473EE1